MKKEGNHSKQLTEGLLLIYLIILVWIILLKFGVRFTYMEKRDFNLMPFANGYFDNLETVLNIVVFIPLGIYTSILFSNWTFKLNLLIFFLISLMFEALQYEFKLGVFDVTDLLTNTTGGIFGYILVWQTQKFFSSPLRTQKFINIIAAISTSLIVLLLILLKLGLLPIKYQ